jgi:uncharacterized membrane protein
LRRLVEYLNALQRVLLAVVSAALLFFLLPASIRTHTRLLAAWDFGAALYVLTSFLVITQLGPAEVAKHAARHDVGRTIGVGVAMAATIAGFLGVVFMLEIPKGPPTPAEVAHLLLSLLAVALSWVLIHTLYAFRYARLYSSEQAHPSGPGRPPLAFPGTTHPVYVDFAYFSFTIGTSFSTPDVPVTSSEMRRVVMVHSIVAFLFNAIVIALAVSIFGGLIP